MNAIVQESNLVDTEDNCCGSLTFLNFSGDITVSWDEHNCEKMLELIKKKMSEGYTFFTAKKVPLVNLTRRVKVTSKNIGKITEVIILLLLLFLPSWKSVDSDNDPAATLLSWR